MRALLRRCSKTAGRVPIAVWAVTVLFGLLMVLWSTFAPLGRAPDEFAHVDLVDMIARGEHYPDFDGRRTSTAMVAASLAHARGVAALTPEAATSRGDRPTFEELGGSKPSFHRNQIAAHPPLYYWVVGNGLRVQRALSPGDEAPLDREWNIVRLMNVGLVLPVPLLAWGAARRLGAPTTVATVAAIMPLTIPQLLHGGASVNNDNLLVLLGAVLAVLVPGVLHGDRTWRRAASIGPLAGLALATKAWALAFAPWIACAYGYQALRTRKDWKRSVQCGAVALATMVVVGGWWPARNVLRGFGPFPHNVGTPPPSFEAPGAAEWARRFAPTIVERFWGNFGYYTAPLTSALVAAVTVAVLALAVLAFAPARRRLGSPAVRRGPLAAFAIVFPVLLGLIALLSYNGRGSADRPVLMQGRYLFAAIVPFFVVVAAGLVRALGRWAPLAVLGTAVVMHVDAARAGLRDWWAEEAAPVTRTLEAMVRWSPWPEAVTYTVVLATAGALAFLVVYLARGHPATGGAMGCGMHSSSYSAMTIRSGSIEHVGHSGSRSTL